MVRITPIRISVSWFCALLCLAMMLCFFCTRAYAAPTPVSDSDQPVEFNFQFHFPVNVTQLRRSYMDNAVSMERLKDVIATYGNESVDSVLVVAMSSPEGGRELNLKLAKARAEAMKAYLVTTYPELEGKIKVRADVSPWPDHYADKETLNRLRYTEFSLIFHPGTATTTLPDDAIYEVKDEPIHVEDDDIPGLEEGAQKDTLKAVIPDYNPQVSEDNIVPTDNTLIPVNEDKFPPYTDLQQQDIQKLRRPILGISTNIPYDITWIPGYGITSIPSFSLEYYPKNSKHLTFGADVEWPMWKHWDTHRFMQINNITLWLRRYFPKREDCTKRFDGLYLFGNINAARYGIGWDDKGWEGEGLGASLGIGYKCGIGKSRFYFDTGIAVGYFYSRYDPYVYGNDFTGWYYYDYDDDPADFILRRKKLNWLNPTRIYVSIGLDLFNRKKDKK